MKNDYIFVRHGETEWSKNGIMHGQYDIPLNSTGKEQATALSKELSEEDFDICYTSPLSRALETAQIILKNQKKACLIIDDRLKELYKGDLEGAHASRDDIYGKEKEIWLAEHGAENKQDFYIRVSNFLSEIDDKNEGKKILIVSHCGTMRMANFFFNTPKKSITESYYDTKHKNCVPYKFS